MNRASIDGLSIGFLMQLVLAGALCAKAAARDTAPDALFEPLPAYDRDDTSRPPDRRQTALFSNHGLPIPGDPSSDIAMSLSPGAGKMIQTPADGRAILLFSSETGPASLSWSSSVLFGNGSIRADTVLILIDKREILAFGDVLLIEETARFACETLYIDVRRKRGYASDALLTGPHDLLAAFQPNDASKLSLRSRREDHDIPTLSEKSDGLASSSGLTMRAGEMLRFSETRALINDLRLTTSTLESPEVELRFKRAEYKMLSADESDDGDTAPVRLSVRHLTFRFLGVPIFYFPWAGYNLATPKWFIKGSASNSTRYGYMANGTFGWRESKKQRLAYADSNRIASAYLSADARSDYGAGAGVQLSYRLPVVRTSGRFIGFGFDESAISETADDERATENTNRLNLINESGAQAPRVTSVPSVFNDEYLNALSRRARDGVSLPNYPKEFHADDTRSYVGWRQRTSFGSDRIAESDDTVVRLDIAAATVSDRDAVHEYEPAAYLSGAYDGHSATFRFLKENLAVSTRWTNQSVDSLMSAPVDTFADSVVEYLPDIRADIPPSNIGWGVLFDATFGGGRLRRRYFNYIPTILDDNEIDETRLYGSIRSSRPFQLGALRFDPYVGGQTVIYDDYDPNDASDVEQRALVWGLTSAFRLFGHFPNASSDRFQLNGLTHIMDIRAEYDATGATACDPAELPGFDEWDDMTKNQTLRFVVDQRLIAGGDAPRDWLGLRLWTTAYPDPADRDRLTHGQLFDAASAYLYWNPHRRLSLDAMLHLNPTTFDVERVYSSLTWRAPNDAFIKFKHYYQSGGFDDNAELTHRFVATTQFSLTSHWNLKLDGVYERSDSDRILDGLNRYRCSFIRVFNGAELAFFIERSEGRDDVFGLMSFRLIPGRGVFEF